MAPSVIVVILTTDRTMQILQLVGGVTLFSVAFMFLIYGEIILLSK